MKHRPPRTFTSYSDPTHKGSAAPVHAHLALQTGGGIDDLTAIPEGAHLFTIVDPTKANTICEYILEKVVFEDKGGDPVLKEIRLVAFSKHWQSTRRMRLVATWEGEFKSPLAESQQAAGNEMSKRSKE